MESVVLPNNEKPQSFDSLIIGVAMGVGLCLLIAVLTVIVHVCLARRRRKQDKDAQQNVAQQRVNGVYVTIPKMTDYGSIVGSQSDSGSARLYGDIFPRGNENKIYDQGEISNMATSEYQTMASVLSE